MLSGVDWPGGPEAIWPGDSPARAALFGGRGLFRMSLRVEVEDEGVKTGDWLASLEELPELGDWLPSLESLFFLPDLLESLPRESWAC